METIGDAYMIVGGVPKKCDAHALSTAKMAFSMIKAMKTLKDPSDKSGKGHLKLRVGWCDVMPSYCKLSFHCGLNHNDSER